MSRVSTPASELGRLSLGASSSPDGMPVTTRAQARRQSASQTASGRTQAGPSRRSARSSRAPADNDSDDSGADSEDEEEDPRRAVYQIMAAFDPGHATPDELLAGRGPRPQTSAMTRRLADVMVRLAVANGNVLTAFRQSVPVPSGFWSEQLAENMMQRFATIRSALEQSQRSGNGQGVTATVSALRSLYRAIDAIRARHASRMSPADEARFVNVLVAVLDFLISSADDLYVHRRSGVAYAGEGFQSERRLFHSWISAAGQPIAFLEVLLRFRASAFRVSGETYTILDRLYRVTDPRVRSVAADDPDWGRLNTVLAHFYRLVYGRELESIDYG
ncbi:hypothetical protein Tdes44962_MAKER05315 [Teratosphaeria destructans]|uniref:Uncharacterized protein n=1 Tax=Teratosphaeria destructans TaxID=418781 RepID=A0A9W7VYY8_9PEZI|nr:hypothetical protein Tdes44962_MAKER05315 [Teratosphaeria destructans]